MPSVSSLLEIVSNSEQISNIDLAKFKNKELVKEKKKEHTLIEPEIEELIKPNCISKPKEKKNQVKDFDIDIAQIVYRGIQQILEKDEFDIFNTKANKVFDIKIKKINTDIERLIKLNVSAKEEEKKLSSSFSKLKQTNDKKISILREKLS